MPIAIKATIKNAMTTALPANGVGHHTNPTIGNATSGNAAVVIRLNIAPADAPKLISAMRAMSNAIAQKSARNNATKTTSRKSVA